MADPTAVPAVMAILESMTPEQQAEAYVCVATQNKDVYDPALADLKEKLAQLRIIDAPIEHQSQSVLNTLKEDFHHDYDYAWICGESALVKNTRALVVKEWGIERTHVMFSGYWKNGNVAGEL